MTNSSGLPHTPGLTDSERVEFFALLNRITEQWIAELEQKRATEHVGRWIPLRDRQPDKFVPVLVHLRGVGSPGVAVASAEFGKWHVYGIDHAMYWENVSHWMPLPEPPA